MPRATYNGNVPAPITCSSFNREGSIFAYGVSYDWSRGYSEYNPQTMKSAILLHPVKVGGPSFTYHWRINQGRYHWAVWAHYT
jgi:hypothetical protein